MDKKQSQTKASSSNGFASKFVNLAKCAITAKSEWTDKDEFLDSVYWIRQFIGLIIGVIWGLLSLKGMAAILIFFVLNALIIYIYAVSYQKIDEDEYGGIWDVIKEGFMTSFSTFLISWIVVYSALLESRS